MPETAPAEHRSSHRSHHRVTFAVLATGVGAYGLLQSLVTPVLHTLQVELGTSQTDVTWVLTAYLISASIFTPVVGRLGDMTGKKRMFVLALVALALGCLVSALATSLPVMILGRVVQGVGGGVLPLSFGIIRDEFPADRVPGAVGAIAALIAVGSGVGIVLAGPIVDLLGYHWLFWLPTIVLAAAAVAAHVLVPESPERDDARLSWGGAVLLAGWLVALLLPVSQGPGWGWASARVLGLLAAAVVLAVAWVVVESRSAHPLVDMRMMRVRAVWTTNLVALLFGFAMYAAFAFLPEFLQTPSSAGYGFGASVTASGLMLLPQTVTMFVLAMMAGLLTRRFGARALLLAGSLVSVAAYTGFALAHDERWMIFAIVSAMGAGFGLAFAALSNLIVAAVPPQQTGVASGMNANIRTIGGAIGAAVMASVVTAGATTGGLPRESGYTHGFLVLAAALALSALATLAVPALRGASGRRDAGDERDADDELLHAELALVPAGTLAGDQPE